MVDKANDLDVGQLPITARRWHKLNDAVAVVADLKNSTKLGTGKWAASTASIYQASTGGVVRVFDKFDADFLAIQGDGAFELFWGECRYERAFCAGITIKTFGRDMVERLEYFAHALFEDVPHRLGVMVGLLRVSFAQERLRL